MYPTERSKNITVNVHWIAMVTIVQIKPAVVSKCLPRLVQLRIGLVSKVVLDQFQPISELVASTLTVLVVQPESLLLTTNNIGV